MASSARIDELQKKFNENPRRYFAPLADEYRKAGDLQGAIELCRAHLAQQPGHMSGHIVLGKALYEGGELDEARQTFETALGLDPENLIALRHLGDIARQQGDAYGARQWYQRVLDADPRNEEIAAQIQLLDDMPATQAFASGTMARVAEPELTPELAAAPDTLAESTVDDGTLPPALEPSAIAYLSDEPTLEVPAYRPPAIEPLDLDMSGLGLDAPPATPRRDEPRTSAPSASNDIGLESMEFVAPSGAERTGRADGLERPEYDFDPHVVDGAVGSEATPAAFVTETMAELYLQQGFTDEALQVYRQLLEASPTDANLRARVQQLEAGGRSSLAFGVSEEVVRAAQERRARSNRTTARRFFASLAARRPPPREGGAADAYAPSFGAQAMDADHADAAPTDAFDYGATGVDTSAMDAATLIAAQPEAEPPTYGDVSFGTPDAQADDTTVAGAVVYEEASYESTTYESTEYSGTDYTETSTDASQGYEEPAGEAQQEYDAQPTDPRTYGGHAYDTQAYETQGYGSETPTRPATGEYDVAAYERAAWDANTPAPTNGPSAADDAPRGAGNSSGTVDALFGGVASPSDESAANALAGAFAGTPAAIPAVRPATGELSLDQVFRETPRRGDAQRRESSGFSFDQFFSDAQGGEPTASPAQPPAPGGNPGDGGENDEQFNAWLEGLKQK